MGFKQEDLSGIRFGSLLALEKAEPHVDKDGIRRATYKCICDCGNMVISTAKALKEGSKKSCGCYVKNRLIKQNKENATHNGSKDRLYSIWRQIKLRCYKDSAQHYDCYGGRGITMCDDWHYSYQKFKDWAYSNGYDDKAPRGKCTIDRIDFNGNYTPDNCRWVDMKVQGNNRRNNVKNSRQTDEYKKAM